MNALAEKQIITHFKSMEAFSREDLRKYFVQTEGEMNEGTLGWRIHYLKQKNIICEIKRSIYTVNTKPIYSPLIDDGVIKLAKIFTSHYHHLQYCVWNIKWLNDFAIHQMTLDNFVFETEKDMVESVGKTFADEGYVSLWGKLRGSITGFSSPDNPINLQSLITRAPLQHIEIEKGVTICIPTLEKILVDIYDTKKVFYLVQGDIEYIFEHAIERYAINYTTLLGYAKRRGKEEALREFIKKIK